MTAALANAVLGLARPVVLAHKAGVLRRGAVIGAICSAILVTETGVQFLAASSAQAQEILQGPLPDPPDAPDDGSENELSKESVDEFGEQYAKPPAKEQPDGWYDKQAQDIAAPQLSFLESVLNKLFPGIIPSRSIELNRTQSPVATRESWTGAALTKYGWSIYSGLTWAPFGNDGVGGEGWRIRLSGGRSLYQYQSSAWNSYTQANETTFYSGSTTWSDLMIGYKKQVGQVTVKAFIGATRGTNGAAPFDPGSKVLGTYYDVKGALETWINLSPKVWLSSDISYARPYHSYGFNSRLGYRLTPALSVGPEVAQFGNDEGSGRRAGGFARYEWDAGEISASAGVTGDLWWDGEPLSGNNKATAYGSVNVLRRF